MGARADGDSSPSAVPALPAAPHLSSTLCGNLKSARTFDTEPKVNCICHKCARRVSKGRSLLMGVVTAWALPCRWDKNLVDFTGGSFPS